MPAEQERMAGFPTLLPEDAVCWQSAVLALPVTALPRCIRS
jgi:hypothetical protein